MPADCLLESAKVFDNLLSKDFVLVLENGLSLRVVFKREQFYHLAGLHKLEDLPELAINKRMSAGAIYKRIIRGELTEKHLKKSSFYFKVEQRIKQFALVKSLLNAQVVIDFDDKLLSEAKLKADYLLFKRLDSGAYLHLALRITGEISAPISFFYEQSKMYITGQKLLDVVEVRVEERKSKGRAC